MSRIIPGVLILIERWKSKVKRTLRYLLMKLFSQNLEVLAPWCDAIISKLGQKDSNLYVMYNCKNIKIRNYKFFFLTEEFLNLKHWSSLWHHYCKIGIIRAESCESCTWMFWFFYHNLYMMFELGTFLGKFVLMTSKRTSKGWGGIRILILIFLSLLVYNVEVQILFDPILR